MSDPRLCVIGAGGLATNRIYPYLGAAGAQLVGVCDLDLAKAERNARRFGGRPYRDYETMLARERPDGVIICIGPVQHAAIARQVLALGYPVYTEKPPATSAAETLAVARAAHRAGLLCMTAFKKRYAAAYVRAHEWLGAFPEQDRLALSLDYASAPYSHTDPRNDFLLDFALHGIDLVGFLFGDVAQVFAFAQGLDAYAVSVRFACGAVGTLAFNDGRSFVVPTEELEITVRGGHFMTIHNSSCWRITEHGKPVEWREPPTFVSSGDSGRDTGHLAELEAFVCAVKGGGTPPSTIANSYKSMVFYEAIRRSAETGTMVPVSYDSL